MLARAVVDLLLPSRCPGCAAPTSSVWCARCLVELSALALPAEAWEDLGDGVRAVGAYAYTGVVRDSLVAAKVRGHSEALAGMAVLLRRRLSLPGPSSGVPTTWVPTTPSALRERGLCVPQALAGQDAVPLLRAVRRDVDQTALSARARRRSKRGAFSAIGRVPASVVLVDDVRTTGATARAAAEALRDAGARRVLVATFAVAGDAARRTVARTASPSS